MKKLILSVLVSFAAILAARAQGDVTFEVAAPTAVEAGELFRIEFVANASPSEFTPPAIEGFEIMAGPSKSTSTSMSLVNGDFTKTETITYTYVLQGFTAGIHTISPARITVRGNSYSTKPVTIEVVGGASQNSSQNGAATGRGHTQGGGREQQQGRAPELSSDDIFMRAVVSRSEVYKGEPLVVTLKLYSRVQFNYNNDLRLPTFNGFWQQDISPDNVNTTGQRETSGNRVYNTWVLKEYLLYPQQSGTLSVDPFEMSVSVFFQTRGSSPRNIFDQIMGSGLDYEEVRKKLSSQPVKINVREWPGGAPASFGGAVGQFDLTATPPSPSMKANTSGSYTLRLSGTGNFPLIRAPKLALPPSFEEYNITTSDNTRHLRSGTAGYREFSYPFIPRADGLYEIPPFEFSYFDPRQGRYMTLWSRESSVEVVADSTAMSHQGGIVSGVSREELKIFGEDIRFIKRGGANLRPKGKMFMWSPLFFSLVALAVVLFAAGFIVLGRYLRNMQSDRFVRGKRANKVALKRFRAAETSMKQDDRHGFHDEMLKALWGYIGDKFDIPMADLSKDRIREELFERNVPEASTREYIRIISECEEAQYSPASSARMGELYREGVSLISELESAIKRR